MEICPECIQIDGRKLMSMMTNLSIRTDLGGDKYCGALHLTIRRSDFDAYKYCGALHRGVERTYAI